MKAVIDGDLVQGIGFGDIVGIDIPEALAILAADELRVLDGTLIDARGVTTWYVDAAGNRHIEAGAGRQQVTAGFFDVIEPDGAGGWRLVDQLVRRQESRKAEIDAAAERERLRYITPGAGQAMTYQAKVEEARALAMETEDPDPAHYPLLSAEIGITAPSLAEVASVVVAAYQQWQMIGAAIEAARLGAKRAVDLAETLADLDAIEVTWPNP